MCICANVKCCSEGGKKAQMPAYWGKSGSSLLAGMVAHVCNPSSEGEGGGVEPGRSGVQGHSWLHRKFQASLGFMKSLLIETEQFAYGE